MNSKGTYSAAARVAEIEDLLTDILLRLPVKTLIKFKCVSKQWRSLISSAQFGISHTRIHRGMKSTPTALLLNKGFDYIAELQVVPLELYTPSLPSFDFMNVGQFKILQSCNGLLLCRSSFVAHHCIKDVINGFLYVICNPTTGQSKRLSFSDSFRANLRFNYLISVSLAFDPNISPHYKVIFIVDLPQKTSKQYLVEIYVYSSENDGWTSRIAYLIEECMRFLHPPTLGIGFRDGVFSNGAIHWSRYAGSSLSLLCFLLDTWTFKNISLPVGAKLRYFGESQGHLFAVVYSHSYYGFYYDVLEIAADYSGCFYKYQIHLQSLITEFPGYDYGVSMLGFIQDKNEEPAIVFSMDGRVMSYNLLHGTFKYICDIEHRRCSRLLNYEGDSYKYFESLISV